ncbi:hypothetical protein HPB48_010699 [Haemaphysalis longicornis]|uniref:Reverse transcriptase domain-containing protein n=1 Tax=Haemaphysalis longicornis TaxID=44386 RepID=A0A9J6G547_HAELO|nr:hypothetical protein HPB48_010699 [Haemaphysalis longicornis]
MILSSSEALPRSSRSCTEGTWSGVYAFLLGVEGLHYNISHDELFSVLRQKIEHCGEIRFSSVTGGNSDNFLELLDFYLHSTVASFEDKYYTQRSGICIGSSLAPILSDAFLGAFDKRVSSR